MEKRREVRGEETGEGQRRVRGFCLGRAGTLLLLLLRTPGTYAGVAASWPSHGLRCCCCCVVPLMAKAWN